MNKKTIQMSSLLAYVLVSSIIVYITKMPYFYSILFVLIPPSITNFLWLKNSQKKILIFSSFATFLFAFAVELISRLRYAWDVQSILPRLFGIIPLENIIFAFINFFWVLSFYEYFIDKDTTKKISNKFRYLVYIFLIFSIIVFFIYFYNSSWIGMDYVWVGIMILLIPSIAIFSKNIKLLKKTIIPVLFFFFVFFVYEIVSIMIGSWWWPGNYICPINFFGYVFPIDDIIIWYIFSTITLIGGYEFFADDFR